MVSNSCSHDEVYRDMCVLCGIDLRHLEANKRATTLASATVSMIHSVPELKVSREKAEELGRADEQHLLNDRRLVLLVDLDQTVIHTTNSPVSPTLKDVHHFQLYGPDSPWYHTKIRPHAAKFLQSISKKYQLHICTFGVHVYAHTIARILDPDKSLFGYRILSRDELMDPHSKTGNLSALFPCGDELVCIIDDREDVWNFSANCIAVKPYLYFKNTGDINWPPQEASSGETSAPSASTSTAVANETEEDTDDHLLHLEDILDRIHAKFYQLYDEKLKYKSENEQIRLPDLKDVIPQVRSTTLAGCNLVFSGVIPTNAPMERSREYIVARSLGATVGRSVIVDGSPLENTTHVVAAKMGTAKVNAALKASKKRQVHIVNPLWLSSCAERWERVSEQLFALKQSDDFQGKCQLQNRVPHSKWYESSSNKLVDSIPLAVFSADDLHNMDQEVEEACSTDAEDDDEEEEKNESCKKRKQDDTSSEEKSKAEPPECEDDSQDATVYQAEEDSNFSKVGESDDEEDGSGTQLKDYNSESSTSTSSNECSNEEKRRKRKRKWQESGNDNDSPSSSSLDENMAGDLVEQEFLRESM